MEQQLLQHHAGFSDASTHLVNQWQRSRLSSFLFDYFRLSLTRAVQCVCFYLLSCLSWKCVRLFTCKLANAAIRLDQRYVVSLVSIPSLPLIVTLAVIEIADFSWVWSYEPPQAEPWDKYIVSERNSLDQGTFWISWAKFRFCQVACESK